MPGGAESRAELAPERLPLLPRISVLRIHATEREQECSLTQWQSLGVDFARRFAQCSGPREQRMRDDDPELFLWQLSAQDGAPTPALLALTYKWNTSREFHPSRYLGLVVPTTAMR